MKLSKVLSLMLAICMLFTMTSFAAPAFSDVEETATYAESVNVLSALNILKGYDEDGVTSFKPDGKITRAEFSAVVARMMGMGDAGNNKTTTNFSDVPLDHWASGYISAAQGAGIINGMGDGTFQPEAEVTYEQSVKMLVAAIGYTPKAEAQGGYPTGYTLVGNQEGVTAGTANQPGGAARSVVARLAYNTLTVPNMEQEVFGGINGPEYRRNERVSILYTKLGIIKAEATIKEIPLDKNARNVTLAYNSIDKVAQQNNWVAKVPASGSYTGELVPTSVIKGDVNLNGLQGLTVTALVDVNDDSDVRLVYAIPKTGKNPFVDVDPMLLDKRADSGYVRYYKNISDDKTTAIQIDTTRIADSVYINLARQTANYNDASSVVKEARDLAVNAIQTNYRYVDTDNDGLYDTVFVTTIQSFIAGDVNTNSNKVFRDMDMTNTDSTFNSASLELDPEDENVAWSLKDETGKEIEITDIEKGQIVNIMESEEGSNVFYDVTVNDSTISGIVSETYPEYNKVTGNDETYYTIGGQAYQTFFNLNPLKPGDEIEAMVAANGKIIGYAVSVTQRNYAMITAANVAEDFGKTYQLQLLKADGTIATLNIYDRFNDIGSDYAAADVAFKADFMPGTLVVYETNSKNEIKRIAPAKGDVVSTANYNLKKIDSTLTGGDVKSTYRESSEKIGSYTIDDKTAIFTTETVQSGVNKNNVMLSSKSSLIDDHEYEGFVISDSSRIAFAVVLFEAANQVKWDSYPLVITRVSTKQVEGESRVEYTGFVNGEETKLVVADDKSNLEKFGNNDIILFSVNGADEIVAAERLARVNGGRYEFAVNSTFTAPIDDTNDNRVHPVASHVSVLASKPSTAKTDANYRNLTTGSAYEALALSTNLFTGDMKGYAVAGKAYDMKGQNLQLMVGEAFSMTKTAADGKRDYTLYGTPDKADGLLTDVSTGSTLSVYSYNTGGNKTIRTAGIADLETDRRSGDSNIDTQFDNDDFVYIYRYDGRTYLVLIVNADGDR